MKRIVGGLFCLALIVLAGCSPSGPATVKAGGTVNVDGKPAEGVTVTFIFENNSQAAGVTDAGGKFNLQYQGKDGAPVGKAKVTFSKVSSGYGKMPANPKPEDMMKAMQAKGKDAKTEATKDELPGKYLAPETSGESKEVTAAGPNDFKFELSTK